MTNKREISRLISAVKRFYKEKDVLDKKLIENRTRYCFNQTQSLSKKDAERLSGAMTSTSSLRKSEEDIKRYRHERKEEYGRILAEHKKLVSKNTKAKVAGYQYCIKHGLTPKIGDIPEERTLLNCLATDFLYSRIGPTGGYLDNVNITIDNPESSLVFGENLFHFAENVESLNMWPISFLEGWCFDTHNFKFIFVYDSFPHEDGTVEFSVLAHPNGGYFCWQDSPDLPDLIETSAVWAISRIDFAQYTPTGDLQIWEGAAKELFSETMTAQGSDIAGSDSIAVSDRPFSGFLDGDIQIDHGAVRPIYNNFPFIVTVLFQANFIVGKRGNVALDLEMNVPMVTGEAHY